MCQREKRLVKAGVGSESRKTQLNMYDKYMDGNFFLLLFDWVLAKVS